MVTYLFVPVKVVGDMMKGPINVVQLKSLKNQYTKFVMMTTVPVMETTAVHQKVSVNQQHVQMVTYLFVPVKVVGDMMKGPINVVQLKNLKNQYLQQQLLKQ